MNRFSTTNKGFTLIETIVAIFILSLAMGALLTLAANGFYSVRYARNQIVADNLMQESLVFIRNNRDTAFRSGGDWNTWRAGLSSCFESNGCIVDVYTTGAKFIACSTNCPYMSYYENQGIYGYTYNYPFSGESYETSYVRTIKMTESPYDSNQITVTSTMRWLNGGASRTTAQSVVMTNWSQ